MRLADLRRGNTIHRERYWNPCNLVRQMAYTLAIHILP